MREVRATVVRAVDGQLWLRLNDRGGGCGRCDEPGGCRSTRLTDIFKGPEGVVCLPDTLGVGVGEGVRIAVADQAPILGAVVSYVLPLGLMLVLGGLAVALSPFDSPDANVLVGVVAGLVGGVLVGRRVMASPRWQGTMGLSLRRDDGNSPVCGVGS